MILKIIAALFSFLLLYSTCLGAEAGRIYHVKLAWEKDSNMSIFYQKTTSIFESLHSERVLLYTEYGNLEDIHIWLSDKKSYDKLESVISDIKSDIGEVIVTEGGLNTPLHKIFSVSDQQEAMPECEVRKTMGFENADAVWAYLLKMQNLIYRRGHLIFMQYVGKTKGEFDMIFSFMGDCRSKDEIVSDLLRVIASTHPSE